MFLLIFKKLYFWHCLNIFSPQVAIDEGMGGIYAREKEIWLGTEIEKYFKTYSE